MDVSEPAKLAWQLAVSGMPGAGLEETLVVTCDGVELAAAEVTVPGSGACTC